VTRDLLPNPADVRIHDGPLDFERAKMIAEQKAAETLGHPMLLSWYDAKKGVFSPNVTCCSDKKPGWIVYAESRGGDFSVDINDEEFVFIYGDLAGSGEIEAGRALP